MTGAIRRVEIAARSARDELISVIRAAMAVTARRTDAKVKSSAMRPRQPEVPNLIGEAEMLGEALIFLPGE